MIKRIKPILFKKISRISPSQFSSMKNCSYKAVLSEAFDKKPLLPVSPNAYFGTVLHKVLELIFRGIIKDENDLNRIFQEQISVTEERLKEQGYSFFLPLQKNVKDFGIKKVLLKKHFFASYGKPHANSASQSQVEKWLEAKNGLIAGKADLIIENGDFIEIVDFKTGSITQDIFDDAGELFTEIKNEYKEQLKLYAYLYFEATGNMPTRLSLVDLAKQKFQIEFSKEECELLFDEAVKLLFNTNNDLEKNKFTANPNEVNCKYCLYRPACTFFLAHLSMASGFNDVSGFIQKIEKYRNGNVSVFLESAGKNLVVTNFSEQKYDELVQVGNILVYMFNLRKEAVDFVYSTTKTTVIYGQA